MKYTLTYRTFMHQGDNKTCYVPAQPRINYDHGIVCSCVYNCEQFMSYPTDRWGRRIIPKDATCPKVKSKTENKDNFCKGRYFICNGNFRDYLCGLRAPLKVIQADMER